MRSDSSACVDTHVERVAKRLGMNRWKDSPLLVEEKIMRWTPKEKWTDTHHQIIFFGRYHCKAQNPGCDICPLLIYLSRRKETDESEGRNKVNHFDKANPCDPYFEKWDSVKDKIAKCIQ